MEYPLELRRYAQLPPADPETVLRYLGDRTPTEEVRALLAECAEECKTMFEAKAVFSETPVCIRETRVDFGFSAVESASLARHLAGCDRAVVFAATVGLGIDRLIRRYSALSPARALCLQALGTERIEALCDRLESDVRERYGAIRPRFSPGYGDLPLSLQTELFRVLDCPRRIGLSLNRSLLMSPTKSVTAIIGIPEESK